MAIIDFLLCICDAHNTTIYIYLIFHEARRLPILQQNWLLFQRVNR